MDRLRASIDAAFQTNCYWWINYFTRMVAQALIVTKRLTTLDFLNDDIDSGGGKSAL